MKKRSSSKPKCYKTSNDTYPLCLGAEHPADFAENDCINCNLYKDMKECF